MKKIAWKDLRALFVGWELFLHIVFWFIVNFGFFYFISKNAVFGMVTGFWGMVFFIYVFTIPNKRLKTYQQQLHELLKYMTNMNFFLKTGENVLHALKHTRETVSREIQKDIDKTIEQLEKDAVLDTSHFKKYNFPSLDQFHHNLLIKYSRGGDANDLFSQIQSNMLFELKKRDELYRKKKGFAFNVYILLSLVVGMMVVLRVFVPYLWDIFLEFQLISLGLIGMTYLFVQLNLYFLQKKKLDISVRL
ncbi:type II secretion system F family protein [Virgibacillus sp. Bac330]|uniref:type II secretion system F family protein n=1 Tax=Virgibacillus sp. Bac330 TaxID=2419841 RepID=UPI000EF51022|nr:type II secretion system F family protein [Virgibacillus sp. Bac330]